MYKMLTVREIVLTKYPGVLCLTASNIKKKCAGPEYKFFIISGTFTGH